MVLSSLKMSNATPLVLLPRTIAHWGGRNDPRSRKGFNLKLHQIVPDSTPYRKYDESHHCLYPDALNPHKRKMQHTQSSAPCRKIPRQTSPCHLMG